MWFPYWFDLKGLACRPGRELLDIKLSCNFHFWKTELLLDFDAGIVG
jgi:hypothetical protein